MPTRSELDESINNLIRPTVPGDRITSAEHRTANKEILDYVDQQDQITGNQPLMAGFATWSGIGLIYDVTACRFILNGIVYETPAQQVTLAPADPVLDRIDVIALTTVPAVIVLQGSPNVNPVKPQIDPSSQVELSFILIPAAATVPAGTTEAKFYTENTGESTPYSDIVAVDYSYPTNPQSGGVSTLVPAFTTGKVLGYQKAISYNASDAQFVKYWIRLGAFFPLTTFISVYLKNGATFLTNPLNITNGNYGYDRSLVGVWQLITIPISDFVFSNLALFDTIHFRMNGNNASGFQIDDVVLQTIPLISANGVDSFNGRTGNVVSAEGDYKVNVANFAALPSIGNKAKIYVTDDNGNVYQWNGTAMEQIGGGGGGTLFLGIYASLVALQTAYPTANVGEWAQVDAGSGSPLQVYYYDTDEGWLATGGSSPAASEIVAGISEIATQAETNAGVDDLRFVTPLKMETRLQALFGGLPATPVKATAAEVNSGTDNAKFATALALEDSKYLNRDGSKKFAVAAGTNAYTAALTPALGAYVAGQSFDILFTNANTAAATININGLGAKNIHKDAVNNLVSGDITAGRIVTIIYDGVYFQVLGASPVILPSTTGNDLFLYYNFK